MASANKKTDDKGTHFNLVNNYNEFMNSLTNANYVNYVKNNYVKDTVINDNTYISTFENLGDGDNVDLPRFNIPFWDYSGHQWTLDESELSNYLTDTTKLELKELENIPIELNNLSYLSQTIDINIKQNTEYIYAVVYQIVDPTSYIPKSLGSYNIIPSLTLDTGTDYTIIEQNYDIINSSNYTYISWVYFKNNLAYSDNTECIIDIRSTVGASDRFVIKNVMLYEGSVLNSLVKKDNKNFSDYIRFNEKKKWELTNDGSNYITLSESPLRLLSILIDYTDLTISDSIYSMGISFPKNSSILNITIECLEDLMIGATPAQILITSDTFEFNTGASWYIGTDKINSLIESSLTAPNKYPYKAIEISADETLSDGDVLYSPSDPTFTFTSYNGDLDTLTEGSFLMNIFYLSSSVKNIRNLSEFYFSALNVPLSFICIAGMTENQYFGAIAPSHDQIRWEFTTEAIALVVKSRLETYLNVTLAGCVNAANNDTHTVDSISYVLVGVRHMLYIYLSTTLGVGESFADDGSVTLSYTM